MTRWFRMYDDVVNDPKAQKLSDAAFRGWVNLMCLASKNDGIIEQPLENVAFSLRKSMPKTRELLQVLQSVGLLDIVENGWKPHNWDERQFKSDVSTERVKRFRKRNETVSETPPDTEQNITEQNRDGFELFYAAMPKKEKKKEASQAYLQALIKTQPEMLLSAARSYSKKFAGKDLSFATNPVSWLQNERWGDEGVIPRKSAFNSPEELAAQKHAAEKYNGKVE